ncbi:hypothetical protein OJ996_05450 [Luteolibacter sp. GHJ8]|uniref:Uncharacterized protein n=1 Tax=Luteolibacter rhizosphaerae TaxID=2989719 RepID=A0ABT3FZI9_9BACT|nr:hypothetical protein [Luteolibacter rhizosphaerae]MCW1913005.1 hypothetical protein [Luteolibacter rhizosphaerae]
MSRLHRVHVLDDSDGTQDYRDESDRHQDGSNAVFHPRIRFLREGARTALGRITQQGVERIGRAVARRIGDGSEQMTKRRPLPMGLAPGFIIENR